MRTAALKHKVTVEQVAEVPNSYGEPIHLWTDYATRHASFRPIRGREYFRAKQVQEEEPVRFKMRYLDGLTQKMRIVYDSNYYNINSIINPEGSDREMIIEASESLYVAAPELSTGPTATPDVYTCLIEWTTDIPAYHRARYRETGTEDWTITDWDMTLDTSASITLTGLSDDTEHDYQVQSFIDNSAAFAWSPEPADTFTTEAAAPVLTDGPYTSPGLTTCEITWTTDVPAYHRVRYREIYTEDWVYTDWTESPSTNAVVNLSGLEPEHRLHYYDIQSCLVGDGSQAFDWYPGDDSNYFYTTCTLPIVYYDWYEAKLGFGILIYLKLSWKTESKCKYDEARWKLLPYGEWHYLDRTADRQTSHYCNDYGFRFDNGSYEWQCRNTTQCGTVGDWSESQFFLVWDDEIIHL